MSVYSILLVVSFLFLVPTSSYSMCANSILDAPESDVWEEVRALLSGKTFRADQGAYFKGNIASVDIISRERSDREGYYDIEVTVKPYAFVNEDLPPDVEAGARKAYEKALKDPPAGIRASAAEQLARLNAPRMNPEELTQLMEGRVLLFSYQIGSRWMSFHAKTDCFGRALFRSVPALFKSFCSLQVDSPQARTPQTSGTSNLVGGQVLKEALGLLNKLRFSTTHDALSEGEDVIVSVHFISEGETGGRIAG